MDAIVIIMLVSMLSCLLFSSFRQKKGRVNLQAVVKTTIIVPSLYLLIASRNLLEYDAEIMHALLFRIILPVLGVICFTTALATSLIAQLLWFQNKPGS